MVRDPSPPSESVADPVGGRLKGSSDGRTPPRQACIECRRRKIKCSGFGKNGCKTCKAAGVECVFPESQKRGPHKGYFETISTRLSRIERMLQDAIEKQDIEKREASSDEEFPHEQKRRRSKHRRRHSRDKALPPVAALLAPKLHKAPEIPFHGFRPSLTAPSSPASEEASALGVLAQVAHELDRPEPTSSLAEGDYFADSDVLPTGLADSLVQIYFDRVHSLFPIVNKESFLSGFQREKSSSLPNHLAWAVFLAASSFTDNALIQNGPHSRLQIEEQLQRACEQELKRPESSDIPLVQSLILGQLFPAKRERKVALSSWTINGRAVKLALKRKLNVDPQKLGCDVETARLRTLTWWCVYLVDIWDSARRGRPASIHETIHDVPLPQMGNDPTDEEIFFIRLVSLTRILSRVLTFAFNDCQTSSALGTTLDVSAEETVRDIRIDLSEWYRVETLPRMSPLGQNIYIAYLTVIILLHRPLLPTPLANAFSDPVLLLITKCASSIVQFSQLSGETTCGSVPWRLFVPAVGYLTAGVTLAQNAAWSPRIVGATTLRQSAQRDLAKLLDVFDVVESKGHNTTGMSGLLRSILQRSQVELTSSEGVVSEIIGGLPMPHEDPSFFASRMRTSPEQTMSLPEKRGSTGMLQPSAPMSIPGHRSQSLSNLSDRKRKHSQISHLTDSPSRTVQQLPSLVANLAGLEAVRRSPTIRSAHSLSTFSSHSSNSLGRQMTGYPPSTAFHPAYSGPERLEPGNRHQRQWEQRAVSPQPLPPLYDRRFSDVQPPYPPTREHPSHTPQTAFYPDRRDEFYPRSQSPYRQYPAPDPRAPYPLTVDPTFHRVAPTQDPRYRNPTPPLSSATSNSPSWPSGYPYTSSQQRYETTSPRTIHAVPPPSTGRWPVREEYYYPPQRG